MTELVDDVERRLRAAFTADAGTAPDLDPALVGVVRDSVRRGRRRRGAVLVAALGFVAVTLVGVPLLGSGGTVPVSVPRPSPSGPSSGSPSGSASRPADRFVPDAELRYRGVVVPVPAAWLDPGVLRCRTPIADAAYVVEPGQAHLFCGNSRSQSDLTTVVLMPSDAPPGTDAAYAEPEKVLDDGRTQLTTAVPGAPVRVVVTSPDPALAQQILGELRIENDLAGCALEQAWRPPAASGTGDPLAALPAVSPVAVCTYTNGWLRSWGLLDPSRSGRLLRLLRSAPKGAPPRAACEIPAPGQAFWVVRAPIGDRRTLDIWVTVSCPGASVRVAGGPVRRVTDPLYEALVKDGPGISVGAGVLDPRNP